MGTLDDIPQDRLRVAFRRALNESTFFPKVAELRGWAGASVEDEKKVEAQAAWNHVNEYLRKWGVDKLPIRSSGQWITAPPLEPRLEYAVRQIGGLWRLNQITDENYAFVLRDFCEAYTLAPVAELMAPRLLEQFAHQKLLGNVKQSAEVSNKEHRTARQDSISVEQPASEEEVIIIDGLTAERTAELRRQLDQDLANRGIPRSTAGQGSAIGEEPTVGEKSGVLHELTPERKAELRRRLAEELVKRGIPRSAAGLE